MVASTVPEYVVNVAGVGVYVVTTVFDQLRFIERVLSRQIPSTIEVDKLMIAGNVDVMINA